MAVAQALLDLPARSDTVAKPALITRLQASTAPLVTVVAPAGYGKTTLLARWAEVDPRPFAWVTLDARHVDAVAFLRTVASAIHHLEPSRAVTDALAEAEGWTALLPRVGSALAAIARPFVLVVDDLHAVASSECLDALAALLEYVPAHAQLALASREAPPLPLARWRTRGWVEPIGVADLRLDEREAGTLLAAAGVELDLRARRALTRQTEGWPAGLRLAARSLRGAQAGGPARFGGDDALVSAYVRRELLAHLPKAQARFLVCTSVLRRLCAPLCDAVLDSTQSSRTLAALERRNGFLVPMDLRSEWFRHHHLVGEALRAELERTEPGAARELDRRALAWHAANGDSDPAITRGAGAGGAASAACPTASAPRR